MINYYSDIFKQELDKISALERAEFSLSAGIADKIDAILRARKMSQRDLANLTGKRESEVSKWLTGRHNFTTKTIALISNSLGQPIVMV